MRDFLIPSFEQFQQLRAIRKAEKRRRKEPAPPPQHQRTTSSEKQETSELLEVCTEEALNKSLPATQVNIDRPTTANDDDDSATEYGSPAPRKNAPDENDCSSEMSPLLFGDQHVEQAQKRSLPDEMNPVHSSLPPSTSSTVEMSTNVQKRIKTCDSAILEESGNDSARISDEIIAEKIVLVPPHTPLGQSGPPMSPLQDGSPSPEQRVLHQQKPWFRRKRKPKLQQMRLSFSG